MNITNMGTTDEGCKSLYVGNLDPRVTDNMLHEIFGVAGSVNNTKIIPDKNYQHGGLNYGFVEFNDHRSAEQALSTLNGRKIYNMEIKVNWAFQGQQGHKEDTSILKLTMKCLPKLLVHLEACQMLVSCGTLTPANPEDMDL